MEYKEGMEPLIHSQSFRSTGNSVDLKLAPEVKGGQSHGTDPFICRIWFYLQIVSEVSKLLDTQMVLENCFLVWDSIQYTHTHTHPEIGEYNI